MCPRFVCHSDAARRWQEEPREWKRTRYEVLRWYGDPTTILHCPAELERCFVAVGTFVNTMLQELIKHSCLAAGHSKNEVCTKHVAAAVASPSITAVLRRLGVDVGRPDESGYFTFSPCPLREVEEQRNEDIKHWREHNWSTPNGRRKAKIVGQNRALVGHIASFLDTKHASSLVLVSKTFRLACESNPWLWRSILIRNAQAPTGQLSALLTRVGPKLETFEAPRLTLDANTSLSMLMQLCGDLQRLQSCTVNVGCSTDAKLNLDTVMEFLAAAPNLKTLIVSGAAPFEDSAEFIRTVLERQVCVW